MRNLPRVGGLADPPPPEQTTVERPRFATYQPLRIGQKTSAGATVHPAGLNMWAGSTVLKAGKGGPPRPVRNRLRAEVGSATPSAFVALTLKWCRPSSKCR